MPPVLHWASGVCRVPASLPDQARVSLGLLTADPYWFWEQIGLQPDEYRGFQSSLSLSDWNSVWGLKPLYWYSEEFIAVDAGMLSTIRNLLDLDLLNEAFEDCESNAIGYGVQPPADGELCRWCDWCRAITMRDRIDIWLDRSGHTGGSYYQAYAQPEDCDIETEWELVWSGATYPAEN